MTQKTIMAVVALATGVAVAGTTTVSSVEDMPTSGGEGTIRYTGATGAVTKDVALTPAANKAVTLEVPADTTLTFSGKFDVSTGAFIKTGAGTVKLPYVGSYYLGVANAATANADLTWNDGNAVNGFLGLTVADGTLEVGAAGATVQKSVVVAVGVRHDSATDPTLKLVGGTLSTETLAVDRGTSANGKAVTPKLEISGGATLAADNFNSTAAGVTTYANNGVVTVTGAGSKLSVTGFNALGNVNGTLTINLQNGGRYENTRENMDYNQNIGLILGSWDAARSSGLESARTVVNVDGGTLATIAGYLYRYSAINVTNGGTLLWDRSVLNLGNGTAYGNSGATGIDGQRGALHFDNGTLGGYVSSFANWFNGVTNYTVGAGGMKIDTKNVSVGALSGHASYANDAARTAGAEITTLNGSDSYLAMGAGEVPIRITDNAHFHMTVNGRLLGSRSTGRIYPPTTSGKTFMIAGDNTLQEMTFTPGGRTRFRHQGIEADIMRWTTVGYAMPMANGTLALGDRMYENTYGAAWLREKLPVNRSFRISWTYYGKTTWGSVPYGAAAVFQNAGETTHGTTAAECCFDGIGSSVGVAYDVIGKQLRYGENGVWTKDSALTSASSAWADDPVRLTLSYDAESKKLTFDVYQPQNSSARLAVTTDVDLAAKVGGDTAWFGFTGGVGSGVYRGFHCIDDVRIDSESGRGYQKVGGHVELAAEQTWTPQLLADDKNLGFTMKELVYGSGAVMHLDDSGSTGLDSKLRPSVNLGFDSIRGTGTLVKKGTAGLALSTPGAAATAAVDVQAGAVILRREDDEMPTLSAADGDWCFTGPEVYWTGAHKLRLGTLSHGATNGGAAERERTLSANTRRRYRIDRSWRVKFKASATSSYSFVEQGFSFFIHNATAGCEARPTNLCGGYGGSLDNAAAFRFWSNNNFVSYSASSTWNISSTHVDSRSYDGSGVSTKAGAEMEVEILHDAVANKMTMNLSQGGQTWTCTWENANLKKLVGNQDRAYLGFGAMGHGTLRMTFSFSDLDFAYTDELSTPEPEQPYFGTLTASQGSALEVCLDSAVPNATYRLADSLSLRDGCGVSVKAKRAAGTLDLGTVTCAGAASVALADGCTASLAAATGTDDFTVSGDTLTITSPTAFTEETTLRLNDGAKLNLAFSGTLKVRRIYVDGVHQRSGNYTTGDADWIAGGTGHIEMGKGLIMIFR